MEIESGLELVDYRCALFQHSYRVGGRFEVSSVVGNTARGPDVDRGRYQEVGWPQFAEGVRQGRAGGLNIFFFLSFFKLIEFKEVNG